MQPKQLKTAAPPLTDVDSNIQEEAAHRQELLEANHAERAKRAERKANKANGVDRPAQSDDEERDSISVSF